MMLSAAMNGFYGLKRLTGNLPADVPDADTNRIAHPISENAPFPSLPAVGAQTVFQLPS
jgi:hypothetical protein